MLRYDWKTCQKNIVCRLIPWPHCLVKQPDWRANWGKLRQIEAMEDPVPVRSMIYLWNISKQSAFLLTTITHYPLLIPLNQLYPMRSPIFHFSISRHLRSPRWACAWWSLELVPSSNSSSINTRSRSARMFASDNLDHLHSWLLYPHTNPHISACISSCFLSNLRNSEVATG